MKCLSEPQYSYNIHSVTLGKLLYLSPFSLWQLPELVQMISTTIIPGYHRFRGVKRREKPPIVEED